VLLILENGPFLGQVHMLILCVQEAYSSVVEFFGENPKTFVPTSFFPLFVRFVKAYKVRVCKTSRFLLLICKKIVHYV